MSDYYALCEDGYLVYINLGDDPDMGEILGVAVYTSGEGEAQRKDLARYPNAELVKLASESLITLLPAGSCSSVFLDGRKLARSVFAGMLKSKLGLPIKQPRWVRLDDS